MRREIGGGTDSSKLNACCGPLPGGSALVSGSMKGISFIQRYELRSAIVRIELLNRPGITRSSGILADALRSLKNEASQT
jgi:hypothetical protein